MSISRRDGLILCGILVLALLLRVIGLNGPLWYDEIMTVVEYLREPTLSWVTTHTSNNHIFYSLQAKAAVFLLGEHNWTIRLPALLFGLAGICALWFLSRSVVGTMQAHVTAMLLAVSYHHIWFTQNARGYTALMFWWVTAMILFVSGIRRPGWRTWALYGVVVCAAMYTHLTAGFFVAAHVIVYGLLLLGSWLGSERLPPTYRISAFYPARLLPLAGFAIGGVLTLLLYAPFLDSIVKDLTVMPNMSRVDVMQEYQNPFWTILEVARSLPGPIWMTTGVVALAGMLTIVGAVGIGRREPIIAAAVLVHIPLILVMLVALSARIWPRFFFADIGFIFLFATHGVFLTCRYLSSLIKKLSGKTGIEAIMFPMAVVLMLSASAGMLTKNYRFPKQNLAGAANYVESNRTENDALVALGRAWYPFNGYWNKAWRPAESVKDLMDVMEDAPRTWVVVIFPERTKRKLREAWAVLDQSYVLQKTFPGTLGDGDVLVYLSASN